MATDLGGLIIFEGGGVRLFIRDADLRQRVDDGLAFYFELFRELIDSYL